VSENQVVLSQVAPRRIGDEEGRGGPLYYSLWIALWGLGIGMGIKDACVLDWDWTDGLDGTGTGRLVVMLEYEVRVEV